MLLPKLPVVLMGVALVCVAPSEARSEARKKARGALQTKEITYQHEGVKMKGYLAWDGAQKGKRPGVLVVHEWWGHNEYARSRAEKLAMMGYTALAVDMYGDGQKAEHPKDAGKFAQKVMGDMELAKGRFLAAKEALAKHPTVKADDMAAIGYCLGGSVVLAMARAGVDLDLVGSFHGGLQLPERSADTVSANVFVAHGGADPLVKPEHVSSFMTDMLAANAKLTFISYPGVVHAFTNPGATALGKKFDLPLAYDEGADEASWSALAGHLERTFN